MAERAGSMSDDAGEATKATTWRGPAGTVIILMAIGLAAGLTLRMPTLLEANDISRWCTVWALLERGTYSIDDCPWQSRTQDKVMRRDPWWTGENSGKPGETVEPPKRFYSSKPPMMPTLIAGMIYPARQLIGKPIDHETETPRIARNVRVDDPAAPGGARVELQTPEPHKWSLHVAYLKPVLIVLNVLPLGLMLVRYRRYLDSGEHADWPWLASLAAFSFGTYLTVFTSTLNNHLVAAWAAFFAFFAMIRAVNDDSESRRPYLTAGFFAAFCACNELPAASLAALLGLILLVKSPKLTLTAFVPAAAIPVAVFFVCQYAALGTWIPAYAEFGGEAYEYPGSYWTTPLDLDYFDKHPEPRSVYVGHMLVGHHGVFSLSPIFLFAMAGMAARMGERKGRALGLVVATAAIVALGLAWRLRKDGAIDPAKLDWMLWLVPIWPLFLIPNPVSQENRNRGLLVAAWATFVLSLVVIGFYGYKTNNYGGSTQGLRWLFWLIPLWVTFLPDGFRGGANCLTQRRLGYLALGLSFLSVGYGIRSPWTHPWILDALDRLGWYVLVR
jgi:hypothetical protein